MTLSTRQKRYLRGLTHQLHPVVTVADKGLSENVMSELETAFDKHELIKVKLRGDRSLRKQWIDEIGTKFDAERIQVIGQVACFYKPNPEKAIIELPAGR